MKRSVAVVLALATLSLPSSGVGAPPVEVKVQIPTRKPKPAPPGEQAQEPQQAATARGKGPTFPKLPPRAGDLVHCPTQEILSRRFPNQSDRNGGGFGYYAAAYDANRVPGIVDPDPAWVEAYVADEAAGKVPEPEEKLAYLWGLRCAYPEIDYVKAGFEQVRAEWLAETGVRPETEAAWHTLLADAVASDDQRAASCPKGDAFAYDDPAKLARQVHLCGGMRKDLAAGALLEALDGGDPVVAAGFVGYCPDFFEQSGNGDPLPSDYWDYKVCQRVAATFTPVSLDAALREDGVSDYVRLKFQVEAEQGLAALERRKAGYAKLEKGWPGVKAMWDATVAQVDKKYIPLLAKWQPTVDEIDPWLATLHDGPAAAEGCAEKWSGALQRYVAASKVAADDQALVDVVRDPIGAGLLEAYAVCRSQTGDPGFGEMVSASLLPGTMRVTRWHHGLVDALTAAPANGTYKGQKLPPDTTIVRFSFAFEPDPARRWLPGVPNARRDPPYSFEETVKAVKDEGETVLITFPTRSGTEQVGTDCAFDYSTIDKIDAWGKVYYVYRCKSSVTRPVDDSFRSVRVPKWQAERVAAGTKVAVFVTGGGNYRVGSGGSSPLTGALVTVSRGDDVIWAGGAQVK